MTDHALVTRRMLLREMGRAGLAVMVLGTVACSTDPTDNATPSMDADTTPVTDGETSSRRPGDGLEWHRANLGFVSAYILYRGGEAAVVDTGVAGSEAAIEAALGEVGLGWDSVGHLIVTHKHPDHQGSVEAVLEATEAPWYAGAGDLGAITAPTQGAVVGDGDRVFDLKVIDTPGHTPGHISILDEASGILVAGDAINGADGGVVGPNPDFTEDMDVANASVRKLAGFDFEKILFGHGEPVLEAGSDAVSALAAG